MCYNTRVVYNAFTDRPSLPDGTFSFAAPPPPPLPRRGTVRRTVDDGCSANGNGKGRKQTCRSYTVSRFGLGSDAPICRPRCSLSRSICVPSVPHRIVSPPSSRGTRLFRCWLPPGQKGGRGVEKVRYFLFFQVRPPSPSQPSPGALEGRLCCSHPPQGFFATNLDRVAPQFLQISAPLPTRATPRPAGPGLDLGRHAIATGLPGSPPTVAGASFGCSQGTAPWIVHARLPAAGNVPGLPPPGWVGGGRPAPGVWHGKAGSRGRREDRGREGEEGEEGRGEKGRGVREAQFPQSLVRLPPLATYLACLVPRKTEGPAPPRQAQVSSIAQGTRAGRCSPPPSFPSPARTKQGRRFTILGWPSDWILLS